MIVRFLLLTAAVLAFAAAPARAGDLAFTAFLHGDAPTSNTGSAATGDAKLVVHEATQSVDMTLSVHGLTMAALAQHLAHAPVGPVHLHIYQANGDSALLLPFPMGASYAATSDGFTITVTNYPYADGAKIIASTISFTDFVKALQTGAVVLNIHSQKFPDGEISGKVEAAQ
jgi:hypothetical protein